jgi:hypothetical protein
MSGKARQVATQDEDCPAAARPTGSPLIVAAVVWGVEWFDEASTFLALTCSA